MGIFSVRIEIGDLHGLRFEPVDAMVDTGATYARMPRPLLERLGVPPLERETFILGDDRRVEYDVGQAQMRIEGRTRYGMVIFGEEHWQPLLGAITLQEFGLGVDPFHERLIPVVGLLM